MIKINDDTRIVGKDLNFAVENKQIIREHFMTNPENIGNEKWITIGYFTTFSAIEKFLKTKMSLSDNDLIDLNNIFDEFNKTIEQFKTIEVPKNMHLKIIINKDWYCIGSHMFYRVIKRESIKKHRFTKEENIGKDKFINTGAVPNIYIALKSILNNIILEYLSSEKYCDLIDIKNIIESFKQDSQNLHFIEIIPNSTEEDIVENIDDEVIEEYVDEIIEDEII